MTFIDLKKSLSQEFFCMDDILAVGGISVLSVGWRSGILIFFSVSVLSFAQISKKMWVLIRSASVRRI